MVSETENKFSLKASPSVVTDHTKLTLELKQSGPVNITVYDLTGRKIKSVLSNKNIDEGRHEYELSVIEFPSGIYICSAQSGESKAQCKFVVQK